VFLDETEVKVETMDINYVDKHHHSHHHHHHRTHEASASSGTTDDSMTINSVNDEAEGIWSADIEQSFLEALAIYPPCGRRKIILTEEGKMYGRNELVARYIKIRTGKTRTRKQVSSHLQVLAKRRSKELQSLRNDKAAQQIILDRLKRYTSAEIVSMNNEQIASDDESLSSDKDDLKKQKTSSPVKNLLQPIPMVEHSPTIISSSSLTTNLEHFRLDNEHSMSRKTNSTLSSPQTPVMKKPHHSKTKSISLTKTPIPLSMPLTATIPTLMPTSPILYPPSLARSRCSSNTSSSSPLSAGSITSQNPLLINNPAVYSMAMIGDEHFRLHEINAFVEIKRAIGSTHPSLIYPAAESFHMYQHDLLRLNSNDIQMKTLHMFETISIDQIFDKFPHRDGLKDLFENNPNGSFFLIKFWADVAMSSSVLNLDESFFTTYTFISSSNRPVHISTRLCSFGRQVLEKVDASDHPQRDPFDQYIHRFDRSALCDYMVHFIQKLRSLPKAFMMNSVLENFTVLQVIKSLDIPERLLLCLAFVFEIATPETGGPQYQVYKLVSN